MLNDRQLHQKITQMSDRIRSLEEALAEHQSGHPLLSGDLLSIKSALELYSTNQTGAGMNGQSPHKVKSVEDAQDSCMDGQDSTPCPESPCRPHSASTLKVSTNSGSKLDVIIQPPLS